MSVITLNDDETLINCAQPIINELCVNIVRVDAHFSAAPFKAKIADAEKSRVPTMLVIGARVREAGAGMSASTTAAPKARSRRRKLLGRFWWTTKRGRAERIADMNPVNLAALTVTKRTLNATLPGRFKVPRHVFEIVKVLRVKPGAGTAKTPVLALPGIPAWKLR